jgi:exodeoxyribonuclease-5
MNIEQFAQIFLDSLPFEPTDQQIKLVAALSRFCSSHTPSDTIFLLNGYAGTGKTSVMGALVRTLKHVGIQTVLLASTGRAAKVFSNFTGEPAYTIHRKIYRAPTLGFDGRFVARVNQNNHINTIFIVDEASMIGDGAEGGAHLLEDLIMFVYTGINCKLILLGDTAQLPPVGLSESPAMNPEALKSYGMHVTRAVMTKTVRQKSRSGILYNATHLRRAMLENPLPEPTLTVTPFADISVVDPEDLEDSLQKSFSRYGEGDTILITRSNRRAVDFNLAIRNVIYDREEILVKGERLLVSKNNYFWTRPSQMAASDDSDLPTSRPMEFVANGDVAIVDNIYATESIGGLQFADVRLLFPDHNQYLDAKICLDTLTAETPGATPDQQAKLIDVAFFNAGVKPIDLSMTAQRNILKADPHYNSLQVKYGYAVTCHKAQGGQWASVFIDMGYIPPEAYLSLDFYRWLYTATTRATTHLSLINPSLALK